MKGDITPHLLDYPVAQSCRLLPTSRGIFHVKKILGEILGYGTVLGTGSRAVV